MFTFGEDFRRNMMRSHGYLFDTGSGTPVSVHLVYKDASAGTNSQRNPAPAWYAHVLNSHLSIGSKLHLVVFTDDRILAARHVSDVFKLVSTTIAYRVVELDPITSLFLMTQCVHHMLTYSALGFWGAYLSRYQDEPEPGRVFYPNVLLESHSCPQMIPMQHWQAVVLPSHASFAQPLSKPKLVIMLLVSLREPVDMPIHVAEAISQESKSAGDRVQLFAQVSFQASTSERNATVTSELVKMGYSVSHVTRDLSWDLSESGEASYILPQRREVGWNMIPWHSFQSCLSIALNYFGEILFVSQKHWQSKEHAEWRVQVGVHHLAAMHHILDRSDADLILITEDDAMPGHQQFTLRQWKFSYYLLICSTRLC